MLRLAHLSDVHLGPLPDMSYRELAFRQWIYYRHRNAKLAYHHLPVSIQPYQNEHQDTK